MSDILIIGGGIGGLTLALSLQARGIACRVIEAAADVRAVGVGINILPHAMRVLDGLGLMSALECVAVETQEATFFNRFGQLIYAEPLGRFAGFKWPQLSIHRGDLQLTLLAAVRERIGMGRIITGVRVVRVEHDVDGVTLHVQDSSGAALSPIRGRAAIGCDGIHSGVRKQLHPSEGPPRYSGVNMWRGTTRSMPFLQGANLVRAGWLTTGKLVIYPIRNDIDADGRQLINWVAEIETPQHLDRDWNRAGRLEDFLPAFADWTFDWLDVPALLTSADSVFEYPMVDQDPLPFWTTGRVTLLGDAAHPMVPRGSNGSGQAILDCEALANCLAAVPDDVPSALATYEAERRPPTSTIVLANRTQPPDAIIGEVVKRTGDKPFHNIDDVISQAELRALSERYKQVSGSSKSVLAERSLRG